MDKVNYIKHLKEIFIQFTKDNRLNPTHISLYLALFHIWNSNRFASEFYVCREELMSFSKIGSKSTYHKCIKELSHWKYLIYFPSHNPFKGSKIKMFDFGTIRGNAVSSNHTNIETSCGQVVYPCRTNIETGTGQALVSIYKHNKQIETYKGEALISKNEVVLFFKEKEWPDLEAEKFYNYYQALDWKINGNKKIINWKPVAENWMLKAIEFEGNRTFKKEDKDSVLHISIDHLKVNKNKNYNEPL